VTHAIIVDAVRAGGKPGDIYIFNSENITSKTEPVSSTHGVGIAELITMLKFQGISPPITIIGMEPKDISAGLEVTPEVEKNLLKISETIAEKLAGLGIKLKRSVKRA
jgi:hydrogenase maturation protease